MTVPVSCYLDIEHDSCSDTSRKGKLWLSVGITRLSFFMQQTIINDCMAMGMHNGNQPA
ncbi:MAG: hypothetical protein ACLTDX_11220 [[Clostridium] innocuum]